MFWHSAGYSPRKSWRLPTRHDLLNIDNELTKSITLPINVYGIVAYYLELLYYQGVEKLSKRKQGETKMTQKAQAEQVEQGSNKIPEGWARIYAHELAGELYSLAGQLYSAENKANQLRIALRDNIEKGETFGYDVSSLVDGGDDIGGCIMQAKEAIEKVQELLSETFGVISNADADRLAERVAIKNLP